MSAARFPVWRVKVVIYDPCHPGRSAAQSRDLEQDNHRVDHNYYAYILASRWRGALYVGVTNDLTRRTSEHKNDLLKSFTSRYQIHNLVWFEHHTDVEEAILREKRIKRWRRAWKFELIEDLNPAWRDLYADIL